MSDLIENRYRLLKPGELIEDGDEWARNWNPEADDDDWSKTKNIGGRVSKDGPNIYRRLIAVRHYRYLEVGERVNPDTDQYYSTMYSTWKRSSCRLRQTKHGTKYRKLIAESIPNDKETYVPISPDWGEATADIRGFLSGRNRHITINKSNYCWDGSVDFTKQHCVSVSVEEV